MSCIVTSDWLSTCVVLLYIGKEDKCDHSSFRSISLLSVVVRCMVKY